MTTYASDAVTYRQLPSAYGWLEEEPGPRMIREALDLYGIEEDLSVASNPVIMGWANEVGGDVLDVYTADSVPWCALFMAVVAKRAGKKLPIDPLWALNWGTFGQRTNEAMLGDVLVFVRITEKGERAGHVGLYVGEDHDAYHVLGGNQDDRVCITRIDKARLYAVRRPNYRSQPENVRVVFLSTTAVSDSKLA